MIEFDGALPDGALPDAASPDSGVDSSPRDASAQRATDRENVLDRLIAEGRLPPDVATRLKKS